MAEVSHVIKDFKKAKPARDLMPCYDRLTPKACSHVRIISALLA